MLLVSNNLFGREIAYPNDAVVRVNLAWANTRELLAKAVDTDRDIFLDFPIGRSKPPFNKWTLMDVDHFAQTYANIRYVAISNVHDASCLADAIGIFGDSLILVPKIESIRGVSNIEEIIAALPTARKVAMLDHDDLCADIIKSGEKPELLYEKYVASLLRFCQDKEVDLLRTQGVIFNSVW